MIAAIASKFGRTVVMAVVTTVAVEVGRRIAKRLLPSEQHAGRPTPPDGVPPPAT